MRGSYNDSYNDRIHAQLQRMSSESVVVSIAIVQLLATSALPSTYDAFLAWLLFLQQKISSKTVANKLTTNPSLAIPAKCTNSNNNNIQHALLQTCYLRARSRSVNTMHFRTVPYRTESNRASVNAVIANR